MKKLKKYKIVFDSNILWSDEEELNKVFNSSIVDLYKILKKGKLKAKISLCLPELVINERIGQRLRQIKKNIEKINNSLKNLKTKNRDSHPILYPLF